MVVISIVDRLHGGQRVGTESVRPEGEVATRQRQWHQVVALARHLSRHNSSALIGRFSRSAEGLGRPQPGGKREAARQIGDQIVLRRQIGCAVKTQRARAAFRVRGERRPGRVVFQNAGKDHAIAVAGDIRRQDGAFVKIIMADEAGAGG